MALQIHRGGWRSSWYAIHYYPTFLGVAGLFQRSANGDDRPAISDALDHAADYVPYRSQPLQPLLLDTALRGPRRFCVIVGKGWPTISLWHALPSRPGSARMMPCSTSAAQSKAAPASSRALALDPVLSPKSGVSAVTTRPIRSTWPTNLSTLCGSYTATFRPFAPENPDSNPQTSDLGLRDASPLGLSLPPAIATGALTRAFTASLPLVTR